MAKNFQNFTILPKAKNVIAVNFPIKGIGKKKPEINRQLETRSLKKSALNFRLNWKIYCNDHSSLSPIEPQLKDELLHIYFTAISKFT